MEKDSEASMRRARMNPGGSAAINAGAMMYRSGSVLVPRFLLDLSFSSSSSGDL